LLGKHQAHNASLAVMAAELAATHWPQIDRQAISSGLTETRWPLRFEVLESQPTVVLDAAHNTDSLKALVQVLTVAEWQRRQRVLVFAVSSDKDYPTMLREILPHFDHVVLTRFSINPRSVPPETLAGLAAELAGSGLQVPPLQLADSAAAA
ncbi:MAG: glutamate ligase domain-containing protein, partial [Planctomycetaceae bacterium]